MRYAYPVKLNHDDNTIIATSRDVPEAITCGATEQEAILEMSDALGAALAGYVKAGLEIPVPSKPEPGEFTVPVNPLVAAKIVLIKQMRLARVNNAELARMLGISEGAVRRLVDPDHASRLDKIVTAIFRLGGGLVIEDYKKKAA